MSDKSYFVPGLFTLIHCKNCGFDFLLEKMTEEELGKYYPSEDYYSFHDYNQLAVIYHKLCALYFSGKSRILNFLLSPFEPLLYTYYIKSGNSVLEVGCGNGLKLDIYKSYGLKPSGIEPYGPELTEKEKSLNIIRKNIDKAPYKKNSFDIIILKEVLEHVPDQLGILSKCSNWLKSDGKLIITVPNTSSLWRRMFRQDWFGYDVPRHLYNYNPYNIKIQLGEAGLTAKKIRTYEPPYMLDGSLKFYFTKPGKPNKIAEKIIFSNITKLIFTPISLIVSKLNLGSLMEVECVRK